MFDGNDLDFTQRKAEELISRPRLGKVTAVYERIREDSNSNFECDVTINNGLSEETGVPYNGGHSNQISPPKVGDTVLIVYRESANEKPILMDTGYTIRDRPPLARAGMYRDVYDSWQPEEKDDDGNVVTEEEFGPAGRGDIKVTGYTQYDKNPGVTDKKELTPERSYYQISKEVETSNPTDYQEAPMSIEMFDSMVDDEAHVTISLNKVDGEDTDGTWGIKFNLKTGEFKIVDSEGYGITSDGSGNFEWNYESINYSQGTTDFL